MKLKDEELLLALYNTAAPVSMEKPHLMVYTKQEINVMEKRNGYACNGSDADDR